MGPKVYRAPNENPSDTLSIYPPSCIAGLYLVLLFASSQYIDSIDIYAVIISYIYMHAHMGRGGRELFAAWVSHSFHLRISHCFYS